MFKIKKIKNCVKSLFILFFLIVFLLIGNVSYAGLLRNASTTVGTQVTNFNMSAGFESNIGVIDVLGYVIQAVLGLLGIIFLILIIYAGFNWMTAAGEEEKVTKAKETLNRAIIGLIITIGAYAISDFVFWKLLNR